MKRQPLPSDQKLRDAVLTARLDLDGVLMSSPRFIAAVCQELLAAREHFRQRGELCRELEGAQLRFVRLPKTKSQKRTSGPRSTKTGERAASPRSSRRAS